MLDWAEPGGVKNGTSMGSGSAQYLLLLLQGQTQFKEGPCLRAFQGAAARCWKRCISFSNVLVNGLHKVGKWSLLCGDPAKKDSGLTRRSLLEQAMGAFASNAQPVVSGKVCMQGTESKSRFPLRWR